MNIYEQIEKDSILIKERANKINKLCDDIELINEITKDLFDVVNSQTPNLDTIEDNINTVDTNVKQGTNDIIESYNYQSKTNHLNKCLLICGTLGLATPFALLGVKTAIGVSLYTGLVGLGSGYIASKKIKPKKIDKIE